MSVLEFVLEGLERALELERELGVRSVECDRAVLGNAPGEMPAAPKASTGGTHVASVNATGRAPVAPKTVPGETPVAYDFVFLHDRPLSEDGITMMAKIITALGKTADSAPVIVEMPVPKARIYVVLGRNALRKFMPGAKGAPGQWIKSGRGRDVLITYSPEYILRFGTVTPAVRKIKEEMWLCLKSVKQRLGL